MPKASSNDSASASDSFSAPASTRRIEPNCAGAASEIKLEERRRGQEDRRRVLLHQLADHRAVQRARVADVAMPELVANQEIV